MKSDLAAVVRRAEDVLAHGSFGLIMLGAKEVEAQGAKESVEPVVLASVESVTAQGIVESGASAIEASAIASISIFLNSIAQFRTDHVRASKHC